MRRRLTRKMQSSTWAVFYFCFFFKGVEIYLKLAWNIGKNLGISSISVQGVGGKGGGRARESCQRFPLWISVGAGGRMRGGFHPKHWQSVNSFFPSRVLKASERCYMSWRTSSVVSTSRRTRADEREAELCLFYVRLEEKRSFGNFHCRVRSRWGAGVLKEWKMDDFQPGRGVFTPSVVSVFGMLPWRLAKAPIVHSAGPMAG